MMTYTLLFDSRRISEHSGAKACRPSHTLRSEVLEIAAISDALSLDTRPVTTASDGGQSLIGRDASRWQQRRGPRQQDCSVSDRSHRGRGVAHTRVRLRRDH